LPVDLREGETLDAIGPSLYRRFGRLDVLVHAAAVLGKLTPTGHIQPKDWEETVGVNLTAAWRLIRTCDPLLRAAPAGRAVFVTDSRAREPRAYWGMYGATKAAMEHLILTWADELRQTNLRVNLFDPGPMGTRLRMHAFPGIPKESLPKPEEVAPAVVDLCLPGETRLGALVRADDVLAVE